MPQDYHTNAKTNMHSRAIKKIDKVGEPSGVEIGAKRILNEIFHEHFSHLRVKSFVFLGR
jgi:hypothetical protein